MPPRPIPAPNPAPPIRVLGWPLPAYRYVPGLNPHPFRHAQGHLYVDGGPPVEAPWSAAQRWSEDRRYLRALDLFDQRYPWEAHEALEALWHFAPRGEPLSELLQGLIQLSACLLKRHMGQDAPADRLWASGERRLRGVAAAQGPRWRGVHIPPLLAATRAFRGGDDWPLIDLTEDR